jgi:hypothetical protein
MAFQRTSIVTASGTSSDVTSAFRYASDHVDLKRASGAADAQAFLFYCFIFGQSLLFLERGPRKRAQPVARSAEKLLDDGT